MLKHSAISWRALGAGGICCIDEFDGIREADKVSIHEVMEQQTLSIAKAGLITTLTTRTSIFGSMNPKGNPKDSIAEQTGLSGPLLSRFDILLPVHDTKNAEQDELVAGHILNHHQQQQAPAEQVHRSIDSAPDSDSPRMVQLCHARVFAVFFAHFCNKP